MTCLRGPGQAPRQGLAFLRFYDEGVIPQAGYPVLRKAIPAGFPSPAADYIEGRLSLDEHLIEHPAATFFVRVDGNSMTGFGIHDGDLLVVDRASTAVDRSVVIAVVEGDFTVKQLCRLPDAVLLRSNSKDHGDILVGPDETLTIWGVVRYSIHRV